MDDATANRIRAKLDAELAGADPNVGIAFEPELYRAFKERDWFTLEKFGVAGLDVFTMRLPAYGKSHFAFSTWDLGEGEFKVGKRADRT